MKIKLPEGWKIDPYGMPGCEVITTAGESHNRYYATIDWNKRIFRSGMATTGTNLGKSVYAGRAWRQRLVDDAVKFLLKVMTFAKGE